MAALVPRKIENLLLAGRDICGTHMAHSNYRVMPICANMGQAAGVAASLCVKRNVTPRVLDVKLLQKRWANGASSRKGRAGAWNSFPLILSSWAAA